MIITKEGTLASFYTVNKAPIKHLRVYFSPKQAGTGDPSPENVREISGWNSISYANLFDKDTASTIRNGVYSNITLTSENTIYPNNLKITGKPSATSNIPIVETKTLGIQNQAYYIYGLPTLDYTAWVCGNGTN